MEYIREMKNSGESRQLDETAFGDEAVWATVTTKEDIRQIISYRCDAVDIKVKGDDIVWSAKVLAGIRREAGSGKPMIISLITFIASSLRSY